MFDWNDQELANIIWGEECEGDDHIVPYPEANDDYQNKKECNQESDTFKSTEQQCLAEANPVEKGPELFQNSNEAKEQFDDYGWANLGSFDDLDQIFSTNDTIFSNGSLSNVDDLWSSRDATNSPTKAFPLTSESPSFWSGALRNVSDNSEVKTEYVQKDEPVNSSAFGTSDYSASHGLQNAPATGDHAEYAVGKIKSTEKEQTGSDLGNSIVTNSYQAAANSSSSTKVPDKAPSQRKVLRSRKKLEDKNEGKSLQDFYVNRPSTNNPSGQFENQLPSPMVHSSVTSVLGHKRQLQGPDPTPYQHMLNQYLPQPTYGTLTNACQAMPVVSHIQPGTIKNQSFLSSSDVSLVSASSRSADTCPKPSMMTTQEKIEKLRRRQQLQAILAIKKQQQQLSQRVSCTNQPTTQKCPKENQLLDSQKADLEVEDLSTCHSLDPNSPVEQDDSSTVSAAVESAEDTILNRLQSIIAKLDIKTRLCIRDSLLRLAQSAVQRNHTSDTSSASRRSKDEPENIAKEEISGSNRYSSMPDVETETNPIDRTVAHLLFHRPLGLSGKHSGPPESPAPTKMPCERKTAGLANLSNLVSPDSLNNKIYSHQESGNYCPDSLPQSADNKFSCKTKSDNEPADGGSGNMEVEGSN